MNDLVEILKITLPSVIMLATVYYIVGGFFRTKEQRLKLKMARGNRKQLLPIRLQAYERLILFLERISPDSLLMRANYPTSTSKQLHAELLQTIRSEFEHNLSQQLYISPGAWGSVKNAKNYIISLVNQTAAEIDDNAPAIGLSKAILEKIMEWEQTPTQKAIDDLKKEIQQIF